MFLFSSTPTVLLCGWVVWPKKFQFWEPIPFLRPRTVGLILWIGYDMGHWIMQSSSVRVSLLYCQSRQTLSAWGIWCDWLARELWINLELVERDHKCMHLMVKCVGCCDNEASLCASQSIRKEKVTVLVVSLWLGLFHRRSSKFESLSHLQGQALLVWRCRGSSVILWKGNDIDFGFCMGHWIMQCSSVCVSLLYC